MSSGSEFFVKLPDSSDEETAPARARQRSSRGAGPAPKKRSTDSTFVLDLSVTSDEGNSIPPQSQVGPTQSCAQAINPPEATGASESSLDAPARSLKRQRIPAESCQSPAVCSADRILRFLRRRLTNTTGHGKQCSPHYKMAMRPSLKQASKQIEDMVFNTIHQGISSSILLVGDHGTGKTLAIESALAHVNQRLCAANTGREIGTIYLNGLVTSSDKSILKEICLQMCRFLKLEYSGSASFEDNVCFLKEVFQQRGDTLAAVFVLDEFDSLVQGSKQQTALYNLFDILQSPSVVACLVGVTSRHDAVELLEKRLQSRFSHRKVLVPAPEWASKRATQPTSVTTKPSSFLKDVLLHPPSKTDSFVAKFNGSVESALSSQTVEEALEMTALGHCNMRWLGNVALLALSKVDRRKCYLEAAHITDAIQASVAMDAGQEELIPQLSVLQMYILVAFCRLEKCQRICNFETAFTEYQSLLKLHPETCESFTKIACFRAFEGLVKAGIVNQSAGGKVGCNTSEYQQVHLMLRPQEVHIALNSHPNCPSILNDWLSKESVTAQGS